MNERLWVLGAADPEMAAIEQLLNDAGEKVVHATVDGVRVHPGNAYKANGFTGTLIDFVQKHVILVECGFSFELNCETTFIDHHRDGDPGYGRPPQEYWKASSLGQVVQLLASETFGIYYDEPGEQYYDGTVRVCVFQSILDTSDCEHVYIDNAHLIAAADHCLAAAYLGECPGVDPEELMQWRIGSRAAFQKRPESEVLAEVNTAREVLRNAPLLTLGEVRHITAKDMRGQHVPELPEASARENICFIADGLPTPDGRVKVVCQSGSPEQIAAFLQEWGPANGLTDLYGDPARGFAGGYVIP